jgi:hypothetical protein
MLDFNEMRDIFPSSRSGIPPWLENVYSQMLPDMIPRIMKQNESILKMLSDPSSFIEAYQPVMDEMYGRKMDEMAKRGIVNSSVTSDAMRGLNEDLASLYMRNLMGVSDQYRGFGGLLGSMGAGTAISESSDPLAPYNLLANMLSTLAW